MAHIFVPFASFLHNRHLLTVKRQAGEGGGRFNLTPLSLPPPPHPPPRTVVFSKIYLLERWWSSGFLWLQYYHKSHLNLKFHWNISSLSEDMKNFWIWSGCFVVKPQTTLLTQSLNAAFVLYMKWKMQILKIY